MPRRNKGSNSLARTRYVMIYSLSPDGLLPVGTIPFRPATSSAALTLSRPPSPRSYAPCARRVGAGNRAGASPNDHAATNPREHPCGSPKNPWDLPPRSGVIVFCRRRQPLSRSIPAAIVSSVIAFSIGLHHDRFEPLYLVVSTAAHRKCQHSARGRGRSLSGRRRGRGVGGEFLAPSGSRAGPGNEGWVVDRG